MKWHLIKYDSFTGQYNMELDLQLVNLCKPDEAYLRFYGWKPYCISLGANQVNEDINIERTNKDGIDIVKRPTGGRAILHAKELTYSVILSNYKNISGKLLYNQISEAIVSGLKLFDTNLEQVALENTQPDFAYELNKPTGALCFASTAKSEIKFNHKKLVGSAQRKIGKTILQHGSILIGKFHKNLANYLNVENNEILILQDELENKTTELETILNKEVDPIDLQNSIIKGFEKIFSTILENHFEPII